MTLAKTGNPYGLVAANRGARGNAAPRHERFGLMDGFDNADTQLWMHGYMAGRIEERRQPGAMKKAAIRVRTAAALLARRGKEVVRQSS